MNITDVASEVAGVDLGDRRLNHRAIRVVEAINKRPSDGFPVVFRDGADLEGFYRLVNNDAVEPDELLSPHAQQAWRRAEARGDSVLVLHDTSEFIYKGDSPRAGLAQKLGSQSFHGHFALAVAEGEVPVVHGVVGSRAYVVEDGAWLEAVEEQEFDELLVGSERWELLAADVREHAPADLDIIHVMDREADDYELWTKVVEQGDDFVIRARHNRRLADREDRLLDALDGEAFIVSREVTLSRRSHRRLPGTKKTHPIRERRGARLSIRAGRMEVKRPTDVAPLGSPHMTLSVVEVVEVDPPDDAPPVRWVLLSTLPVTTAEDICRIVDVYRKRWLIEEFFKSLKTGCAAEKRQGRSLWSLLNTIALLTPVAWRLLQTRAMARHAPDQPADRILDEMELAALRHLAPRAKLPRQPTCRQALLAIARVGGHLRSNGEPGWLVLGRGMEQLLDFAAGWRAAMAFRGESGEPEM